MSLEFGLIVLGDQDVIPAPISDFLGEVPVGEHGVAGHHLARQGQHTKQLQGGLVLVGLAIHPDLLEHGGGGRHVRRQQMDAGGVAVGGTTSGLAVDGDVVPAVVLDATKDPATESLLQSSDVETAEQLAQTALVGCLAAREAEGMSQWGAVVATELCDGFQAFAACQSGDYQE
jgi:hypothetical protein